MQQRRSQIRRARTRPTVRSGCLPGGLSLGEGAWKGPWPGRVGAGETYRARCGGLRPRADGAGAGRRTLTGRAASWHRAGRFVTGWPAGTGGAGGVRSSELEAGARSPAVLAWPPPRRQRPAACPSSWPAAARLFISPHFEGAGAPQRRWRVPRALHPVSQVPASWFPRRPLSRPLPLWAGASTPAPLSRAESWRRLFYATLPGDPHEW